MWSRKARATSSARSKPTARFAISPTPRSSRSLKIKPGNWFNAKAVEDAVTDLNETAGNLGYAFADISPAYDRDAEKRMMNITFKVGDTPRVYVERIDITGNTTTRDKVIRREFRLNEGDAFNALKVKRSQDRIQCLGFFQDKLEIKQTEGSAPDRVVLGVNVEEKPTGQLSLSGGYSSLEKFVVQLAVSQHNFMGKGQELDASVNYSRYSKSVELGFAEPYFLDKPILFGAQLFRRDYNSFNYVGNNRNTTYSQVSTGGGLRIGLPAHRILELRQPLHSDAGQDHARQEQFYTDPDGTGPLPAGLRPAQGRPLSVRRNRHAADLAGRLFRRSTTTPTASARPAASG